MKLPEKLEKDFHLSCGHAPLYVVRALYNVDGNLGGTWLAVGEERIFLFHRASGGQFERKRHQLNELIESNLETEDNLATLQLRFAGAQYLVKCSLFDLHLLHQISTHCQAAVEARPIEAPARLNPASAFCAAIHAILDADGHVDPVETEWLCRKLPDPVAIEEGSAWLRVHGLDQLLSVLPAELNAAQRRCLMTNLIGGVMADGLLEPEEQELIERFRNALQISEEHYDGMFSVLLTRNQLNVLISDDEEDSPALELFAAALLALTNCDDERHVNEDAHLRRILPRPILLDAAAKATTDSILANLPGALDEMQSLCMLANLLAVAMVDGKLEIEEQDLIDRFRVALEIPEVDHERIYSVLLCKNDLSVLC